MIFFPWNLTRKVCGADFAMTRILFQRRRQSVFTSGAVNSPERRRKTKRSWLSVSSDQEAGSVRLTEAPISFCGKDMGVWVGCKRQASS